MQHASRLQKAREERLQAKRHSKSGSLSDLEGILRQNPSHIGREVEGLLSVLQDPNDQKGVTRGWDRNILDLDIKPEPDRFGSTFEVQADADPEQIFWASAMHMTRSQNRDQDIFPRILLLVLPIL